ncbi:hypothetical protein [Pedobacter yulinensis]|uniref:hypothetical protein n=1 Tax=Pedobacter yulinensis TaxID=2126353 RepID=UPI0013A60E82|nr:hypothetical protein [Pedobacter yulinensis]
MRGLVYLFEGAGLAAGVALFANTTGMLNEALRFYNERYNFLGTDSEGRYYQDGK